jgi:hypothetical protein
MFKKKKKKKHSPPVKDESAKVILSGTLNSIREDISEKSTLFNNTPLNRT